MKRSSPLFARWFLFGVIPVVISLSAFARERRPHASVASRTAAALGRTSIVQVRDVPFAAVQVITRSEGSTRWETRGRMARNSVGSTYLELVDPGSGEPTAALIVDVPNKREIVLELHTHVYRIRSVPELEARSIPTGWTVDQLAAARPGPGMAAAASASPGAVVQLGIRRVHGVESVGTRSAARDGSTLESWFAVDLGLAVEMTEFDALRGVRKDAELTEILRAEPDPGLFTIPKGFHPPQPAPERLPAVGEPADGV